MSENPTFADTKSGPIQQRAGLEMKMKLYFKAQQGREGWEKEYECLIHHERDRWSAKGREISVQVRESFQDVYYFSPLKTFKSFPGPKGKVRAPYPAIHGPSDETLHTFRNSLSSCVYFRSSNWAAQRLNLVCKWLIWPTIVFFSINYQSCKTGRHICKKLYKLTHSFNGILCSYAKLNK